MGMFPRGVQAVSMRAERPMKTLSMCRPVNSWSPTALSHLYAGVTTCAPCKPSSQHQRPWKQQSTALEIAFTGSTCCTGAYQDSHHQLSHGVEKEWGFQHCQHGR